jgi:hypothetical protein
MSQYDDPLLVSCSNSSVNKEQEFKSVAYKLMYSL